MDKVFLHNRAEIHGTDVDVQATGCDVSNGMTAEGHGKFHMVDSGHLTGSMDVTFSGNTPFGESGPVQMHADYTSTGSAQAARLT